MILSDNAWFLKTNHPAIWEILKNEDEPPNGKQLFRVEESKTGKPTLVYTQEDKAIYLHSKYDPENEAKTIIESFKNLKNYKHVFFFGTGIGYHINEFVERYPNIPFSIYDPYIDSLRLFLTYNNLKKDKFKNLKNIFIKAHMQEAGPLLNFIARLHGEFLLIELPTYIRVFSEEYSDFTNKFRKNITISSIDFATTAAFSKNWTLNSIYNFMHVLSTPSMIHQYNNSFKDKSVIIVSAGPSLDYEMDNLRAIKDKKMAYIVAVGSANKALIKNDIYPDAITSFDPGLENYIVLQDIIDLGIDSIPLIFGSTVGHSTLIKYPGPLAHMVIDKDTISNYFLKQKESEIVCINDAPSVAIATIQLLYHLGVKKIILVGQNLAYKDKKYYSDSVKYDHQIIENENENIMVEDVYGQMTYTSDVFNTFRFSMENYIVAYRNIEFINTTKYGAKIKGTEFMALEKVMETLIENNIEEWYQPQDSDYDLDYLSNRVEKMKKEEERFKEILIQFSEVLDKINKLSKISKAQEFSKLTSKLDDVFKKYISNDFHKVFLEPVNRIPYSNLRKKIPSIKQEQDIELKKEMVISEFGKYLRVTVSEFNPMRNSFVELCKRIDEYLENKNC